MQSGLWVGLTRGLGWAGLGWVDCQKWDLPYFYCNYICTWSGNNLIYSFGHAYGRAVTVFSAVLELFGDSCACFCLFCHACSVWLFWRLLPEQCSRLSHKIRWQFCRPCCNVLLFMIVTNFEFGWVGLGWVQIFQFAMGWVGLGHSVDGLGLVGSWKMDTWNVLMQAYELRQ